MHENPILELYILHMYTKLQFLCYKISAQHYNLLKAYFFSYFIWKKKHIKKLQIFFLLRTFQRKKKLKKTHFARFQQMQIDCHKKNSTKYITYYIRCSFFVRNSQSIKKCTRWLHNFLLCLTSIGTVFLSKTIRAIFFINTKKRRRNRGTHSNNNQNIRIFCFFYKN